MTKCIKLSNSLNNPVDKIQNKRDKMITKASDRWTENGLTWKNDLHFTIIEQQARVGRSQYNFHCWAESIRF